MKVDGDSRGGRRTSVKSASHLAVLLGAISGLSALSLGACGGDSSDRDAETPDASTSAADGAISDGATSSPNTEDAAPEDAAPSDDGSIFDADVDAGQDADLDAAADDAGDEGDAAPDPTTYAANIVFVSSELTNGDLGGLAGADAKCQGMASAAGLPGTYVAWLSTSTVNAADRLAGSRGWVRWDGLPFADTVADITASKLDYPAWLDENGTPQAEGGVWTGTSANGQASHTCSDWTDGTTNKVGRFGIALSAGAPFTDLNNAACEANYRIWCFGTGKSHAISIKPAKGRYAFASSSWLPSGGVAGADAKCQSEANAAGLPGTYLALLSQTGKSAKSRFAEDDGSVIGEKWVRPDGLVVAPTAEALFDGMLLAPIFVHADGVTRPAPSENDVWAGAGTLLGVGSPETTCDDWNPTASSKVLMHYYPSSVRLHGQWGVVNKKCSDVSSGMLFCLQR